MNIDDYSCNNTKQYSEKRKRVMEAFSQVCAVNDGASRPEWIKTSPININNRTEEELKVYFEQCCHLHAAFFTAIWGGKLYGCPRHGIYDLLGYPMNSNEFINLRDYSQDGFLVTDDETILNNCKNKKSLRDALYSFYSKDFYNACNYCNNIEDAAQGYILPGEQAPIKS